MFRYRSLTPVADRVIVWYSVWDHDHGQADG